jgi:hypothetical protein
MDQRTQRTSDHGVQIWPRRRRNTQRSADAFATVAWLVYESDCGGKPGLGHHDVHAFRPAQLCQSGTRLGVAGTSGAVKPARPGDDCFRASDD